MRDPVSPLGNATFDGFCKIREIGPLGMITLRAKPDVKELAKAIKAAVGTKVPAQRRIEIAGDKASGWMSPDEYLLILPYAETGAAMEAIAKASREMVERFADYILLIYVDVVEFDAKHISRLFQSMRERYSALLASKGTGPLREGVDPAGALMMVVWGYFNYFIMEKLFKVERHYGMKDEDVIKLFARVYRRGIVPE